jgi:hypothetical protein
MNIPDLSVFIFDLCHDSTLLKFSMCSKFLRGMAIKDSPIQKRKGFYVRILKHKYEVTARKLQVIADKIECGVLVERENVPILRI